MAGKLSGGLPAVVRLAAAPNGPRLKPLRSFARALVSAHLVVAEPLKA
jgi:hypothetical protein